MMKLIITGNSVKEIRDKVIESAIEFMTEAGGAIPPRPVTTPVVPTEIPHQNVEIPVEPVRMTPSPEEEPQETASKKKGGRPKKTAAEHLGKPEEVEVAPVQDVVVTKDQAIGALSRVSEKFGIDRARECLSFYKVAKLSQLKESDLAAFTAHCESVLAT